MAQPFDPLDERRHRLGFRRYLLDGERVVTAIHQHWAKVVEPFASVVVALFVVFALDTSMPKGFGLLVNLLWWAWFVVLGRALWQTLEWRHDWFVATDKRLILTYGLITQKVAMMPLAKVTDMSYNRSPMGRLLGYGTFVMESAGQDQALHSVRWVANPDHNYRAICAEMFGVDDHERVLPPGEQGGHDDRFGGGPRTDRGAGPGGGRGGRRSNLPSPYDGYVPPEGNAGLTGLGGRPDTDRSTAIRIRSNEPDHGAAAADRRAGHNDQNDHDDNADPDDNDPTSSPAAGSREAGSREADTGPIHYWRRGTD